jgi:hypothetical protein
MKKLGLVVLSLVVAFVLAACDSGSTTKTYTATLSGAKEVPVVITTATGSATAELDGKVLTVTGTYTGLSGAASNAHIHGPATKTESAGVISAITFTEGATAGSGTLSGTITLTDAKITELQDGLYYVNVHTIANAGGEIRGQLE